MKVKAKEVREKYLKFYEKRGHIRIAPAPLVLENDPTTLFTSSGMQPLVPYLMGEPHPSGKKRLTDSQPSIRLQDIEEVGDNRHTTFFEMLGNWSLGDYFKEEQLSWILEFFTKELGLPKDKLWVTVFEGNDQVPRDDVSVGIWKKLGIPKERIFYYDAKKNWWSRSGTPQEMPVGEIGGPDSEVFFEFNQVKHNPAFGKECHPNCDCGRFLEIGNSVFMQYKKVGENKLEELPQKNVDFGGGLERILAAVNGTPDVFSTDLFSDAILRIEEKFGVKYSQDPDNDRNIRIIAEHMRASHALISAQVLPSNKEHGYILRRLIRRAVLHAKFLSKTGDLTPPELDFSTFGIPIKFKSHSEINNVIKEEADKFSKAVARGLKRLNDAFEKKLRIDGNFAFDIYQTEGFPLELTLEALSEKGMSFSDKEKEKFRNEFLKHQEKSRTTSAGVFKGGLADHSEEVVKLHTATHLLLASLRKMLGGQVVQKGQNITKERSRFDFPNPEKLTDKQLKEVEKMINDVIKRNLPVNFEVMPKEEALKTGAIHAFNEKYADTVKVYFVGKDLDSAFSKEFCGGPHVNTTGEIGRVRINKQEKIGSGLIRIYLTTDHSN